MEKHSKLTAKKVIIILGAVFAVCIAALVALALTRGNVVPATEEYGYVNADNYIPATRIKGLYKLNKKQAEDYLKGDGVDFRVVRKGTDVYLFVDGEEVCIWDLTQNNSGVTADRGVRKCADTYGVNLYERWKCRFCQAAYGDARKMGKISVDLWSRPRRTALHR